MSWDFDLCDPVTKEVLATEEKHMISGGTCCVGGTTAMTLNVTYNYSNIINKNLKNLKLIMRLVVMHTILMVKQVQKQLSL